MTLSTERTVRELAVEIPNATRIFEKFKIDYCCGGSRSLESACENAGVHIEEVVRQLEGSPTPEPSPVAFQPTSATELINHIQEKHHTYTREEIARLTALISKVCSVHGGNHPELLRLQELFVVLAQDLEPHMFKEERILFPYIGELEEAKNRGRSPMPPPFGTVSNPVRMMMMEHDTAGDLLRIMRHVTDDYTPPADACFSYNTLYRALEDFEKDLHQHIHLENNILFPLAEEMESEM